MRLPIPLNSKHLMAEHLKRLVATLDLPTTAASKEVRQMVEGKLTEQGREPLNVQVVLGTTSHDVLHLQDVDGVFLTMEEEEELLMSLNYPFTLVQRAQRKNYRPSRQRYM